MTLPMLRWRVGELVGGLVGGGLVGLDLGRDLLGAREEGLLLVALRLGDLLAHRLLLGAQLLERSEAGAVLLLRGQDGVDDALVLAPGALRGAHSVGVVAEQLEIDHAGQPSRAVQESPSIGDISAGELLRGRHHPAQAAREGQERAPARRCDCSPRSCQAIASGAVKPWR